MLPMLTTRGSSPDPACTDAGSRAQDLAGAVVAEHVPAGQLGDGRRAARPPRRSPNSRRHRARTRTPGDGTVGALVVVEPARRPRTRSTRSSTPLPASTAAGRGDVVDLLDLRSARRRRSRGRRSPDRTRSATGCADPYDQIVGSAPATPTKGLSAGMVNGSAPARGGSMRRILPSRVVRSSALRSGSPPEPPSPRPMYSMPSGPNASWPPLWFAIGLVDREHLAVRVRVEQRRSPDRRRTRRRPCRPAVSV